MRNYSSLYTERNVAYFYSPEPNLVYVRVFAMWADYSDTNEPIPQFRKIWKSEQARYRLRPGEWISERHDWYGNMRSTKEPYEVPLTASRLLHALCGAEKALSNSFLKYHQLNELHDNSLCKSVYTGVAYRYVPALEYRPMRYLCYLSVMPQLEMVSKLGIWWAVLDLVNERKKNARMLNWKAKTPHEFLRLSKEQAKEYLKKYALRDDVLKLVQKGKGEISCDMAAAILRVSNGREDEFLNLLFKYGAKHKKIIEYTEKSKITVSDYFDYIKGAEGLGYDLSVHNVLFPKNFQDAHDEAINGIAVAEFKNLSKAKQRSIEKRAKKYEYSIDGCVFIFPRSVAEIVAEGKNLGHCVGGYAARHIDGKTNIVFMRRADEPQKSWYTIEIDEKKVRQAYGKKNRIRPQDDKEACRAFHLWRCHLEHKVKRFAGSFKNMRYRKIA